MQVVEEGEEVEHEAVTCLMQVEGLVGEQMGES